MTKDPFEELFGPSAPNEGQTPPPVSARDRLAYEQQAPAHTAQLPSAEPGWEPEYASDRSTHAKPWIIVGVVALVAIVASIVVLNLFRAGAAPVADDRPTNTSSESADPGGLGEPSDPATTTPTESETPSAEPTPSEKPTESEKPKDQPPVVDPGQTVNMPIGPWNATSELSGRFGATSFAIPDGSSLILTSDLLNQFPDSCSAMRQQWGAKRLDNGSYEVLRPANTCSANTALYDEVWGLTAAWVKTINPQ